MPFNYVNNSVGFCNPIYGVMLHQWTTTGPDTSSSYLCHPLGMHHFDFKEVEIFGKEKTFTHCIRKKKKPPHFPVKKNDPSISYTENIRVSQYAKLSHLSHFLSMRWHTGTKVTHLSRRCVISRTKNDSNDSVLHTDSLPCFLCILNENNA